MLILVFGDSIKVGQPHVQLTQKKMGEEEQDTRNTLNLIEISDEELERSDISHLKGFFEQMVSDPDQAKLLRGKILLTFPKYDNDPRETVQIDEIRQFIQYLDAEFPYFLYFLNLNPQFALANWWVAHLLPLIEMEQQGGRFFIGVDPDAAALLLAERIRAIDAFCVKILDDSTSIIESILETLPEQVATYVATLLSSDNL